MRDLIREGIEPNSGPGWKEFEEKVLAKFGDGAPLDILKKVINKPFISTTHIREFLLDQTLEDKRIQIGIDKTILPELLGILDNLEGIYFNYHFVLILIKLLITFLTFSCSSAIPR